MSLNRAASGYSFTNLKRTNSADLSRSGGPGGHTGILKHQQIFIDKEKAKLLTPKSFLLILKDLLSSQIEYNALFYAKEYMLNKPRTQTHQDQHEHTTKFKRSQSVKPGDHLTTTLLTLPSSLDKFQWKKELPEVYDQLENFLSLSFRDTIYPPVSKKVLNTKKLQADIRNAIARVRQLDSSKRNMRTKIEMKTSRPTSSSTSRPASMLNNATNGNGFNNEYTTSHFIEESTSTAFILPLTSNLSDNLARLYA